MMEAKTKQELSKAPRHRVRAYKEDYIRKATLAEMRVHQLEVELKQERRKHATVKRSCVIWLTVYLLITLSAIVRLVFK